MDLENLFYQNIHRSTSVEHTPLNINIAKMAHLLNFKIIKIHRDVTLQNRIGNNQFTSLKIFQAVIQYKFIL